MAGLLEQSSGGLLASYKPVAPTGTNTQLSTPMLSQFQASVAPKPTLPTGALPMSNLPNTTVSGVGGLLTNIAQIFPRAAATLVSTGAQTVTGQPTGITPSNPAEKFLFGKEPIPSLQQIGRATATAHPNIPLPLIALGTAAGEAFNLYPGGAGGKKVASSLFKGIVSKLPTLDKTDFLSHILPKLEKTPLPKPNETLIFRTGGGNWADTDLKTALNRGVDQNTEVRVVPTKQLMSTGNAAKDARGERLLVPEGQLRVPKGQITGGQFTNSPKVRLDAQSRQEGLQAQSSLPIRSKSSASLQDTTPNFGTLRADALSEQQTLDPSARTLQINGKEFNGKPVYLYEAIDGLKVVNLRATTADVKGIYGLDKLLKNDALYTKYPTLRNVDVVIADFHTLKKNGYQSGGKIFLNYKAFKNDPVALQGTLIHEIQHLKQDIKGNLPKYSAFDEGRQMNRTEYANNPREVDARRKQLQFAEQMGHTAQIERIKGLGSPSIPKEGVVKNSPEAPRFNPQSGSNRGFLKIPGVGKEEPLLPKPKSESVPSSDGSTALKPTVSTENTLPFAKVPKGAESVASQADQALSKLPETTRKEVASLEDILTRRATDVKSKVNALDYLRTPDRVLAKIGFGKEAKMLRTGYDAYSKEISKNIQKIRAWEKEVPKDSAKTIFQYLDGKAVQLSEKQLQVAGEIKTWLAEWAKRLNLPADKTITNYITHIFDKELIAKEFDEDLAKIITDKIPGSVYDPFLLRRLGAKGYKENVWEALDAYVKRGTRKVNMDPALDAIQAKAGNSLEMSNIEVSQWKYLQSKIAGINMRPTELDNLIDNTVKSVVGYKYGQRPITYLTSLLRRMTYRGMLGLNPGSALRNLSQGINTYAVLGEKYTTIGYAKLFSTGARKELTDEGIMASSFIEDRILSSTKRKIQAVDKGLFSFFQGAEYVNRGAAYFGAKSKALAEGKSLQEAIEYAKSIVRKTQFAFDPVDIPVAMQSDIVKTFSQFLNYSVKQTEFLAEMVKDKNFVGLLRYGVAGMAFVYTIGKLFGMDPKELIPSFRFGTPPSLKLPVEIGKALLNTPDQYNQPRDVQKKLSDVGKSGIGLIPAGTQINKSVLGYQALQQGKSTDKAGRMQFPVGGTPYKDTQALLFGKYANQDAKNYFNGVKTPEQEAAAKKKEERATFKTSVYDKAQSLIKQGNEKDAQALVDGLSEEEYKTYVNIRAGERAKSTEHLRTLLNSKPADAVQYVRSQTPAEQERLLKVMTDAEYALYEQGK